MSVERRLPAMYAILVQEEVKTRNKPALSIHVWTTSLFITSVLTTCSRLVALNSPVPVLMTTFERSSFALTDVNLTLHNLVGRY